MAEITKNLIEYKEGIKELYEELYGYSVEFYQLDPSQSSGANREIKFKEYLEPISLCGFLEEDASKRDRADVDVDTNYHFRYSITIPAIFFEENEISLDKDLLVRAKIRVCDVDYFPYEVRQGEFLFGGVMTYIFTCRTESISKSVVRP